MLSYNYTKNNYLIILNNIKNYYNINYIEFNSKDIYSKEFINELLARLWYWKKLEYLTDVELDFFDRMYTELFFEKELQFEEKEYNNEKK